MASPLAKLLDKQKIAETRARFGAWWRGEDFDPAMIDVANASDGETNLDSELFDEPEREIPARLAALQRLWGEGRISPGDDTSDALVPAQTGLAAEGAIAVLGPGLSQPIVALARVHAGAVAAFEWREESADIGGYLLRRAKLGERVSHQRIDLESHVFEQEKFDAVWSLDEFTFADEPMRLAHQIARMLKPDACVVVEAYAGLPSPDIAPAFASSFAEPHIRAAGDIAHYLIENGLKIEAQDDLTEEHIASAKEAFKRLEGALKGAGGGVELPVARELGWEAEAWRARLKLLGAQRLERRRIIARRPAG